MDQAKKLKSLSTAALLLPLSLLAFYTTQTLGVKINTANPSGDLASLMVTYVLPFVLTIGASSYILWYYKLYRYIYQNSQKLNFYPSVATILSHTPILSCVTLPITLKEMWVHTTNQTTTHSIKLFIAWWALSTVLSVYLVVSHQELVVGFWASSIMLSSVWVYQICRSISHLQIKQYLELETANVL